MRVGKNPFLALIALLALGGCGGDHGSGMEDDSSKVSDKASAVQAMRAGGLKESDIVLLSAPPEGDASYTPRFMLRILTGPIAHPHPADPAAHAEVKIYKDGVQVMKGTTDQEGYVSFPFSEFSGNFAAGTYYVSIDYYGLPGNPYPTHCFRGSVFYDGSGYLYQVLSMLLC